MTGVTAPALGIKEDGTERGIVRVEPATSPVAVDAADGYDEDLRQQREGDARRRNRVHHAVHGEERGLRGVTLEFGGAAVPVTPFLTDAGALNWKWVNFAPATSSRGSPREAGSNLLDGVVEGAKALAKRSETRRVLVSFKRSRLRKRAGLRSRRS